GGLVENVSGGTVVATLSTIDQDAGDSHAYAFVDSDGAPVDHPLFEIAGDEIRVKAGVDIDYEAAPSHTLFVQTTDSSGATYREAVTIDVADVNEAPTAILLSDTDVNENADGASVATLTVVDADAGDVHTFAVSDDRFEVVGNDLKLKDGVSLDHEAESVIDVTVTATDSQGLSVEETFSVNVNDLNEGPVLGLAGGEGLKASYYDIGRSISRLSDIDFGAEPDASGVVSNLNYMNGGEAFWEGGPQNQFAAKYEGQLVVNEGGAYTLHLTSDDGSQLFVNGEPVIDNDGLHGTRTQSVTVELSSGPNDIEVRYFENGGRQTLKLTWEGPDTGGVEALVDGPSLAHGASADNLTIAEDTTGAVAAALSVSDPDSGDSHTFMVDDDRFEVEDIDGAPTLKLKDDASLDHETEPSVDVTVTVTDAAGLSDAQTFTVNVGDTNAAPEISLLGGEGLQASYFDIGRSIRNLDEIDFDATPDAEAVVDSLNYMNGGEAFWEGGPQNQFAAKYEGQLVVKEGGNYTIHLASDDGSELFVDGVAVLDNDGLHSTRTRSVTLNLDEGAHDIEIRYFENGGYQTLKLTWEGPDTGGVEQLVAGDALRLPGVSDTDQLGLTENVAGEVAAFLAISDADGDAVTYAVDDDRFEVVEHESGYALKLKDGVSVDYEFESEIMVAVTATDAHGESATATFTVPVADVEEAVVIDGTSGGNRINGTDADEIFNGYGGNDRIRGRGGDDTIYGGDGNDNIRGDAGADELHGGAGNDRIFVDSQDTVVTGGEGYDRVIVQGADGVSIDQTAGGIERVDGGAGDDEMNAAGKADSVRQTGRAGDDTLIGGEAADVQRGGAGDDVISGGGGDDNIRAGAGDDSVSGGTGNDNIRGQGGDDTLAGGDNNDTLLGDGGGDVLDGGAGDDRVIGGSGDDMLDGGEGADDVRGGAGDDTASGGGGNDTVRGDRGNDDLSGGAGDDRIIGGAGDDTITGGEGADVQIGGSGADVFVYAMGDGSDVINAGGGGWTDVIQIEGGVGSLGELGVDWTVELTRGSVVSADEDRVVFTDNADGVITLEDGATIEFDNLEQII
ncbi:MAG: PA14 domain-containing protein, partial [Hyphococcus sp.]